MVTIASGWLRCADARTGRFLCSLLVGLLTLVQGGPTPADSLPPTESRSASEVVVLLHGLVRTDRSLRQLEKALSSADFQVHNLRYPSTNEPLDELLVTLDRQISGCCADAPRLHFVTHSLGGILVRAYFSERSTSNVGRVVMLAPPNHGSEYADLFESSETFERLFGPTAPDLGTGADSLPNRLPSPSFEFGVIAGTRGVNPITPLVIRGENDGTVSVASTTLPGMSDFITVPVSHSSIMRSDAVAGYVIQFLRHGRFVPSVGEP